jgi:hypothetical protein
MLTEAKAKTRLKAKPQTFLNMMLSGSYEMLLILQ